MSAHCKRRAPAAAIALVLIGSCATGGFAVATPDVVHLARRTDGRSGSGTAADPFDASTAAKFDALMVQFWNSHGTAAKPLTIQLGRGIFETRSLSSYGPNAGGPFKTQHWLATGWTLRGAGMRETEIRNVHPETGGVWMINSTGGSWGGPESGGITVTDLTLNPQKTVHEDKRVYSGTILRADGKTTTARVTGSGWKAGMHIEIEGENYNGARGPWDGGATKAVAAVDRDTISWSSANTLKGRVKVKRVGEWNAMRLNGPGNRVERVRVINAGANSIVETWPLWASGDNTVIDSCVVEHCSGIMSAIASFPGTNRTIRNCRVDGDGCIAVLGISVVELVENCTVRNVSHGIYGDTFSSTAGIVIRNNTIENVTGGGITVRPHDYTRQVLITGNRVTGGKTEVGIWVDPLSTHWTGTEWQNAKGEKIWIDDVTITGNNVGRKRIEMSQSRNVSITDNVAAMGAFYRMPPVREIRGNRRERGATPPGLADK